MTVMRRLLPMDEGAFGVEQVELVIEATPRLVDGRRVGYHADAAGHRRQVATGNDGRRLVIDAHLQHTKNHRLTWIELGLITLNYGQFSWVGSF